MHTARLGFVFNEMSRADAFFAYVVRELLLWRSRFVSSYMIGEHTGTVGALREFGVHDESTTSTQ